MDELLEKAQKYLSDHPELHEVELEDKFKNIRVRVAKFQYTICWPYQYNWQPAGQ